MPVSKLTDLCTRACIKNVRSITNTGDFEYWKIRPILLRVDSPEQLYAIECNSPHLIGETEELWRTFIARDIPNYEIKNYVPKNPAQWYKVYCKYKKERDQDIRRDEETLRQTMMGIQKKRETNVTQIVNMRSVKIPRDPRMRAHNGGVPLTKNGFKKEGSSTLNFTLGSKTKTSDSRGVLLRARREASEIGKMTRLSRPTQELHRNKVSKAPAGMLREHQVASQPQIRILTRRPSAIKALQASSFTRASVGLEEREARLMALTNAKKRPNGQTETVVRFSEDEEDEDERQTVEEDQEFDDLFDDHSQNTHATSSSKRKASSPPSRPTVQPQKSKPALASTYNNSSRDPLASKAPPSQAHQLTRPNSPPIVTSATPQPTVTGNSGTGSGPLKPMIQRKRQVVDIFNRGAKKPRRV